MMMLMIFNCSLKDPVGFMFLSMLLHLAHSFNLYSDKLRMMPYMYILSSAISATGFVHLQVCISLADYW